MKIYAKQVRRAMAALLFIIGVVCAQLHPAAAQEAAPRYRALLIGCDTFVSAEAMEPTGRNNLHMIETMLGRDARGFTIRKQYGVTATREALAAAIQSAFEGAVAGDVSLLYITTHGEFTTVDGSPQGLLLLSDGMGEEKVTAAELNGMLDSVPGTKMLIVDACNSGALIGKGVSPNIGSDQVRKNFQTDDYKVLTSSGASESSWYWGDSGNYDVPPGGSYFTTALAIGAGFLGTSPADTNRDGVITMAEMYNYLWVNEASSTVQMYPQDDSFPLLVYGRPVTSAAPTSDLSNIVYGKTMLDQKNPVITLSYTVLAPTTVEYRVTYLRDGQWDWSDAVSIPDSSEWDGDIEPTGNVSVGRTRIKLSLGDVLPDDWTYAMLHIMYPGGEDARNAPFIYAGRVLSARIPGKDPALSVRTAGTFDTSGADELEIFVTHAAPCILTVNIKDPSGKIVKRLASSRQTRPSALRPEGTLLYWNGLSADREPVPAGTYTIVATAEIGENTFTAERSMEVQ